MSKFDFNSYCMEQLINYVPEINDPNEELGKRYQEYIDYYKEILVYLIYEDILCPYFMDIVKQSDSYSQDTAKRIAKLIDHLLRHKDFNVQCVADVGFLEKLVHDMKPRKDLEKYLLPYSLEIARKVGKTMYGLNPRTWEKT